MPPQSQAVVKGAPKRAMDYYEKNYKELTEFVKTKIHANIMKAHVRKVTVRAGVKSGKRFLAMINAAYTGAGPSGTVAHVFLTCWNRKADKNQRLDLGKYMKVFTVTSKSAAIKCVAELKDISKNYETVIVHYDEFDHGSGIDQLMGNGSEAKLWDYIKTNKKIKTIKYSASPEEGLVADPDDICLTMPDHPNYRGAKYFLDKKLIVQAENPLVKDDDGNITGISDQFKKLLEDAKARFVENNGATPIIVMRIADDFKGFKTLFNSGKIAELVYNDTDNVAVQCEFVASTDSATMKVQWDDYQFWNKQAVSAKRARELKMFFIDQECTRSTDWFLHPFLFTYHDYHGPSSALNTVIQSNYRVAYYLEKKDSNGNSVYPNTDLPIRLYGDIEVAEYLTGTRALENVSRKVSSRGAMSESDPNFGRPIRVRLTDIQMELEHMKGNINDEKRRLVEKFLYELPGLTNEERAILKSRKLLHRRKYGSKSEAGGIHTVDKNYREGHVSGPGGGLSEDSEEYAERHKYFFMDMATEDTAGGIPKGTVYITYGIATTDNNQRTFNHTIAHKRDGTPHSIFADRNDEEAQEVNIPMAPL